MKILLDERVGVPRLGAGLVLAAGLLAGAASAAQGPTAHAERLADGYGVRVALEGGVPWSPAVLRLEKPERAIFDAAVRRAGVPAELCLHAGDKVDRDARGALAAGIPAVLVDHEGRFGAAERALCPVVSSLGALRDLILERIA